MQHDDPVGPRGEVYSRHNELLPLALVPAYRIGGRIGALGMMAIFTAVGVELSGRLFPAPPLTTRQLRRLVYG